MNTVDDQIVTSLNWQPLTTQNELSHALEQSLEQPVAFFKHSIRCGISSHAMHRLAEDWRFENGEVLMYYLDLITFRELSNKLAELLGVAHQSPQLILVYQHKAIFHASHMAVSGAALLNALKGLELEGR